MKRFLLVLFVVFSLGASAQMPHMKWLSKANFDIRSMATDAFDNVIFAGEFKNSIIIGNDTLVSNHDTLTSYGYDVIIVKMDSAGNILWYHQIGMAESEYTADITIDKNNDVYLLEGFNYYTVIEGDSILNCSGHQPLLIKYSSAGDFLWWKRPAFSSNGCMHPRMLRIDQDDNLLIMNDIFYAPNIYFPDTTLIDSMGYTHISKYNPDGNFQWVRAFNNDIYQLTTDYSNNILLIKRTDTTRVFDFIKLSPNGNLLWRKKLNY
jgi:hypothetical protein